MTRFTKTPCFSDEAKTISASMAQRLKPLGYKKRRNGFNKALENGLIHQLSVFSVGAYSIDHGMFYVHAGCYVPEAELYRRNVTEPRWVTDSLCAIRGCFPETYLSFVDVMANLDVLTTHLDNALEALGYFSTYDQITSEMSVAEQPGPDKQLRFETPQPLLTACILIARGDSERASTTLQRYLTALEAEESPHLGHINVVSKWARDVGLL